MSCLSWRRAENRIVFIKGFIFQCWCLNKHILIWTNFEKIFSFREIEKKKKYIDIVLNLFFFTISADLIPGWIIVFWPIIVRLELQCCRTFFLLESIMWCWFQLRMQCQEDSTAASTFLALLCKGNVFQNPLYERHTRECFGAVFKIDKIFWKKWNFLCCFTLIFYLAQRFFLRTKFWNP